MLAKLLQGLLSQINDGVGAKDQEFRVANSKSIPCGTICETIVTRCAICLEHVVSPDHSSDHKPVHRC